ncbi:7 transmembrane receptor [Necator americanus]|uniref:Gamma-aminobutyric acid type B receptor subunit 2 n=1 Tax=Necator americanus TaxID=51031 RepID=W2T655_NECAM|nr:7 transmembrane receptor [Necator americanus]ETN77495.1 7 transmembrane receptor [Necator americanus]
MWSLILATVGFLAPDTSGLSCKPRPGGTPVPLGVFLNTAAPDSLDKKPIDAKPAIKLALNYIQNHSCILDGFKLELIYKDTQVSESSYRCKTSLGMKALFDLIASRPRPVALFGGMCTEVNEPVAMALKYWQIVQLSYAETHAKFGTADSQELYPTFFRIVPGDRNLNNAKCRLINHFGWKKVGTLKQSDEPRHALPHEALTTKLEHGYGIKVLYTAGVTKHEMDNIGNELNELKQRDVRILIVDVAEDMAAIVLCEAYHRQMYGESYVWILPGYHSTAWMNVIATNCTAEELALVFEGHFAVEFALMRKDERTYVIGGRRASHIWNELERESPNMWQGYLYDGLWALAIALSQALGADASFSHLKLLSAINNSSFEGVTGRVRFENNERLGLVDIRQWRNDAYDDVGHYDGASDVFTMRTDLGGSCMGIALITVQRILYHLAGWEPPLDATVIERKREYISNLLFIVMSFLALIGISVALIFLFVNIKYRNHRFIKMSSPNLNNLIIVGSMCTYASVILLGIDTRILSNENFVQLCYVSSGVSENMDVMPRVYARVRFNVFEDLASTFDIHKYQNGSESNKGFQTASDLSRSSFRGCACVNALGSNFSIPDVSHGASTDRCRGTRQGNMLMGLTIASCFSGYWELRDVSHIDDKVVVPEIEKCQSSHSAVFQAILYAIKGILMILGCFLAWETRHVNVPALNDSKYIGMSVYNVVVMSTLGLSISVILQVIELARNPAGNNPRAYRRGMMKSMVAKGQQNTATNQNMRENEKDLLAKAEAENQIRRRYVHQKSTQLWDLLEKLRELGDTQFLQQDWCFASGIVASAAEKDKDPLLPEKRISANGPSAPCENGKWFMCSANSEQHGWPWVDPEEPSTML